MSDDIFGEYDYEDDGGDMQHGFIATVVDCAGCGYALLTFSSNPDQMCSGCTEKSKQITVEYDEKHKHYQGYMAIIEMPGSRPMGAGGETAEEATKNLLKMLKDVR